MRTHPPYVFTKRRAVEHLVRAQHTALSPPPPQTFGERCLAPPWRTDPLPISRHSPPLLSLTVGLPIVRFLFHSLAFPSFARSRRRRSGPAQRRATKGRALKIPSSCEPATREESPASASSTFEHILPSARGVSSRALLLASSRALARGMGSTDAEFALHTPSSRSRLPQLLARANTVRFARDVKAGGQNDPGCQSSRTSIDKFGNPSEVQQPGLR